MTLLGKLFRPWDLSSEDAEISCTKDAEVSTKSAIIPKTEVVDVDVESDMEKISPLRNETIKTNLKTKRKFSEAGRDRDSKSGCGDICQNKSQNRNRNNSNSKSNNQKIFKNQNSSDSNNILCASGSEAGFGIRNFTHEVSKHYLDGNTNIPNNHSIPNFCEPISPADFDLHLQQNCNCSGSPSNIFLYPSTINELASLSRTELTAMGLLPMESLTSMKVKRQRPKRFHCPHCQVAFSNNGQLKGHIRIHTGERPYECEQEGCGKSFTRNEELTRHRRIHSGLRPFPCSYCGKKFGRKDHLKKHTRTHQRGMFNPAALIGYGNPFHQPFNPPLVSTSGFAPSNDLISLQSTYSIPIPIPIPIPPTPFPPPNSHYPFSL